MATKLETALKTNEALPFTIHDPEMFLDGDPYPWVGGMYPELYDGGYLRLYRPVGVFANHEKGDVVHVSASDIEL